MKPQNQTSRFTIRGQRPAIAVQTRRRWYSTPQNAFTLVELMVVVALIAIAMSITLPTMSAMTRDSDRNTAENAVAMAGTIARAYATRPIDDVKDVDLSNNPPSPINPSDPAALKEPGSYSGCIALFTPANEIRIAENGTEAQMLSRSTIAIGTAPPPPQRLLERIFWDGSALDRSNWGDPQKAKHLNGFRDVNIDYIRIPADVGVAGVIRARGTDDSNPPRLLAPPFAVWFDANGTLVAGSNYAPSDFVYYDGNYDGQYDIDHNGSGPARLNDYNPDPYDPAASGYNRDNYNNAAKRHELPFERIEAVMAVIVYSKTTFRADANFGSFNWSDGTSTSLDQKRWKWMKDNGRIVMFTRQNGLTLRGLLEH